MMNKNEMELLLLKYALSKLTIDDIAKAIEDASKKYEEEEMKKRANEVE